MPPFLWWSFPWDNVLVDIALFSSSGFLWSQCSPWITRVTPSSSRWSRIWCVVSGSVFGWYVKMKWMSTFSCFVERFLWCGVIRLIKKQLTTITFIYERWLFFNMERQDSVSNVFLGALSRHSHSDSEKQKSVISLIYVSEEPITNPLSSIHLHIDTAGFIMFLSGFLHETIRQNEH